ncbi:MAG TPA: hypothetical protein VLA61_03160 [Ideonella sp.]|uniref:hypothetical protein n=1 Tax=Ideonella sp. TaxID=1929293 RepID=UPI002B5D0A4A|nr:hypothetical protein [Ideonella sp.]HSI47244.1 hypothetical protein [Ideonella sp.]
MKNSKLLNKSLVAIAALCCFGAAQANNFSKSAYDGARKDIETTYKAEKDSCDKQTGNAKDICVEQAKANEKVAKARLEFNYTGKPTDEARLAEAQSDGRYEVAKEKCDDLAGNAKDVCVKEAKAAHDSAKADLKAHKKIVNAEQDALDTKMTAEYKVAKEKCDGLSGDAKDTCVASAKARYNQSW